MTRKLNLIWIKCYNFFHPAITIESSKELWASLSAKGVGISNEDRTPEQMRQWGKSEYKELITDDPQISKGGTVLDFGCGIGRMTEFFLNDFEKVIGTDISAEFIRQAKERVPKAEFIETDGHSLPLDDSTVDFVLSNAVFQCMPSLEIVTSNLQQIHRCLKKDGRAKLQFRGTPVKKDKWFYGYSFTEIELKSLLSKIGFTIVSFRVDRRAVGGKTHFYVMLQK